MFTVIPLALSMLLATAQEPIEEHPAPAQEQAEDMAPPLRSKPKRLCSRSHPLLMSG